MQKIKTKKHLEILTIDDYFILDSAIMIHKNYVELDNAPLNTILKNNTLGRYSNDLFIELQEKPQGYQQLITTELNDDCIPMKNSDTYIKINKTEYQLFYCETINHIELQGLSTLFYSYLPTNYNLYYNKFKEWFVMFDKDNKLIAVIMPCSLGRNYFKQLIEALNDESKEKQTNV